MRHIFVINLEVHFYILLSLCSCNRIILYRLQIIMKKYEFVSVEYYEIINQYAKSGYQYVGMIPTELSN